MVRKEGINDDEEVAYMRELVTEYMEEDLPEFFGLDPENNVDNEWMIHEWADDPAARNARSLSFETKHNITYVTYRSYLYLL